MGDKFLFRACQYRFELKSLLFAKVWPHGFILLLLAEEQWWKVLVDFEFCVLIWFSFACGTTMLLCNQIISSCVRALLVDCCVRTPGGALVWFFLPVHQLWMVSILTSHLPPVRTTPEWIILSEATFFTLSRLNLGGQRQVPRHGRTWKKAPRWWMHRRCREQRTMVI